LDVYAFSAKTRSGRVRGPCHCPNDKVDLGKHGDELRAVTALYGSYHRGEKLAALFAGQMRLGGPPASGTTQRVVAGLDVDSTGWLTLRIAVPAGTSGRSRALGRHDVLVRRIVLGMVAALLGRLGRIPQWVMLQPVDLNGAQPGPVEAALAYPLPPQPDADTPTPRPVAWRALAGDYRRSRVYQYVARYPHDGARACLATLKEQLARCRAGGDEAGFTQLAEDHLGPDTVLFLRTHDDGNRSVAYVAAVVDQYMIIILVTDPTVEASDPTTANELARAAMRRAARSRT
jgi:hypothetical protein